MSESESNPRFSCPFCSSQRRPRTESKTSTGGWILFAVLIFVCFPVCWLGFFIREDHRVCADCGVRLD